MIQMVKYSQSNPNKRKLDELRHKINLQKDELTYICPNCKAQLKKDSKFCSNCGQRLV